LSAKTAQTGPRKNRGADTHATRPAAAISPARAAAFEILTLVAAGKGHSDDLLHSPHTARLSQEDRNLATALVMGVLRWQIALDARITKLLARPEQPAQPVALALRMGAFQLLHMDRIPAHAVLNESVELCRTAGHPHAAGMVNAVLRKLVAQAQPGAQQANRNLPLFEFPAAFAERLGHPLWLVERWTATYGRKAALAICEYGQHEPASGGLFPSTNAPSTDEADLLSRDTLASSSDSNPALPQIDDGSRLVAELAAAALPFTADRAPQVWDCCAAPGGKTLVLAERLQSSAILATDISARRLARMAARVGSSQHGARIRCEVLDAATPAAEPNTAFDLILCDVPCSGTGTLARNPEIRHQLRPEDLARHAQRQRAILAGALRRLAPGGRLLYSTCSLEPEENEQVVNAVLAELPGMRRISLEVAFGNLRERGILSGGVVTDLIRTAIQDGALRILPGLHPCDGFFAALLERV